MRLPPQACDERSEEEELPGLGAQVTQPPAAEGDGDGVVVAALDGGDPHRCEVGDGHLAPAAHEEQPDDGGVQEDPEPQPQAVGHVGAEDDLVTEGERQPDVSEQVDEVPGLVGHLAPDGRE